MKCEACRYLQRNPYIYPDAEDEISKAGAPGDASAAFVALVIIVFFYFVFRNR